jgi:citrate synthase
MDANAYAPGLETVVAAETMLSDVDGAAGRLVIAGRDVEELALSTGFEEVAGLLLRAAGVADLPADLAAALGQARAAASERIPRLGAALDAADGMDALRGAAAQLASTGDEPGDAIALIGALPVFAAAWSRRARGLPIVPADPAAPHAADYLHMITGGDLDPDRARALDRYLVTVTDHGMNASTFAARVVASTASDPVSAVVGAIGALKGPLHGGAPGPVLDMLDRIGAPDGAAAWLTAELEAGRRIMGMGHRVYRVRDPRAAVLEAAIGDLEQAIGASSGRLAMARAVERAATRLLRTRYPDRSLAANVEFYTAVLLDAIGLPRALFSPTFAVGRVAGWTAHIAEQGRTGRLIRPLSRYVGPRPLDPSAPSTSSATRVKL